MLPSIDDVANNLITGNRLYQSLCKRNTNLTEELSTLKAEWKQLSGVDYPYIMQGKKAQKFIPATTFKKPIK